METLDRLWHEVRQELSLPESFVVDHRYVELQIEVLTASPET